MARRARRDTGQDSEAAGERTGSGRSLVRGALLRPVRHVERELVAPDGTVVRARVPVYPPFRLETDAERKQRSENGAGEDSGTSQREASGPKRKAS